MVTCGNGILDPGEACDQGDCCTSDCTPRSPLFLCRDVNEHWDVPEYCTGTGGDCPEDRLAPHGAICDDGSASTHSDIVTAGNICSGTVKTCPPDRACVSYTGANDGSPFCTASYRPQGTPCADGLSCVPGRSKVCDGFGLCVYAGGTP